MTMNKRPFEKGDIVEILPEFRDDGDNEFVWVVTEGEEKGRVTISPVNAGMSILPNYTVQREWIELKERIS